MCKVSECFLCIVFFVNLFLGSYFCFDNPAALQKQIIKVYFAVIFTFVCQKHQNCQSSSCSHFSSTRPFCNNGFSICSVKLLRGVILNPLKASKISPKYKFFRKKRNYSRKILLQEEKVVKVARFLSTSPCSNFFSHSNFCL